MTINNLYRLNDNIVLQPLFHHLLKRYIMKFLTEKYYTDTILEAPSQLP